MGLLGSIGKVLGGVAGAALGGPAGAAIGSSLGGILGGDGKAISGTLQQGALDATTLQRDMYLQNRADNAPYTAAGTSASNQLSYLLGLNPAKTTFQGATGTYGYTPPAGSASTAPVTTSTATGGMNFNLTAAQKQLLQTNGYDPQYYLAAARNGDKNAIAFLNSRFNLNGTGTPVKTTTTTPGTTGTAGTTGTTTSDAIIAPINEDLGGYGSLGKAFTMDDYVQDPGYQFRLDQGNKALNNSQAARGNFLSGGAVKEALDYNSGLASQEYGNAYNRYNTDQTNLYNRLTGVVQAGQGSAQQVGNAGQNYANQAADYTTQAANAAAAGQASQSSQYGALGSSIGSLFGNSQYGTGGNSDALYQSIFNGINWN